MTSEAPEGSARTEIAVAAASCLTLFPLIFAGTVWFMCMDQQDRIDAAQAEIVVLEEELVHLRREAQLAEALEEELYTLRQRRDARAAEDGK